MKQNIMRRLIALLGVIMVAGCCDVPRLAVVLDSRATRVEIEPLDANGGGRVARKEWRLFDGTNKLRMVIHADSDNDGSMDFFFGREFRDGETVSHFVVDTIKGKSTVYYLHQGVTRLCEWDEDADGVRENLIIFSQDSVPLALFTKQKQGPRD